jgi:hypothetical protein
MTSVISRSRLQADMVKVDRGHHNLGDGPKFPWFLYNRTSMQGLRG